MFTESEINCLLGLVQCQLKWSELYLARWKCEAEKKKLEGMTYLGDPPYPVRLEDIKEYRLLQEYVAWMDDAKKMYYRNPEYAGMTLVEFMAKMRPGSGK